jgi:hypothetical protein
MRRLLLALATTAPLLALGGTPAAAWGWCDGYGYGAAYAPVWGYRPYYYAYRPFYGYAPYYGAYWRPRYYYNTGYFYRPYRPWGWSGYRAWGYRGWGWHRRWW